MTRHFFTNKVSIKAHFMPKFKFLILLENTLSTVWDSSQLTHRLHPTFIASPYVQAYTSGPPHFRVSYYYTVFLFIEKALLHPALWEACYSTSCYLLNTWKNPNFNNLKSLCFFEILLLRSLLFVVKLVPRLLELYEALWMEYGSSL